MEIEWYATEITKAHSENNLVWLLQEPTEWGDHTRIYQEIPKWDFGNEKDI